MPTWSHLHPIVIHFPIALLLAVPFIVILGLLWPAQRRGIHATGLALLLAGTAMAILAVASGLAAADNVPRTPALLAALDAHESLGKQTALLYLGLSLAMILIQALPRLQRRETSPRRTLILHLLWLAFSLGASFWLLRTGDLGGRMVHELGVHGQMR